METISIDIRLYSTNPTRSGYMLLVELPFVTLDSTMILQLLQPSNQPHKQEYAMLSVSHLLKGRIIKADCLQSADSLILDVNNHW